MTRQSNGGEENDGVGETRAVRRLLARFAGGEGGATAVEYTFLVAFVALGILATVRAYSDKMVLVYQTLATAAKAP
ncbi:Flp family type IVb pilin [Methylobacterium sp. J-090]|uniref:Flp family type IVb pilin n=1 Tax=Methylobacterium sp. J-090 TaxID=2836666 RepID=UPI001FBBB4C4|nr:Flp family type IVb pilin [Methylobacterium sp. J-090]MCJ2081991.1 Flp family type IVb pilin [Methylobacterium sp. J-090]